MGKGTTGPKPQTDFMIPGEILKTAPKIFPDFCLTDWNKSPRTLHNFIRGLSPYPCARSVFKNDKKSISFKIFESEPYTEKHSFQPGHILSDGRKFLKIACNGGFLNILSLQLEGKNMLGTEEFLKGFRIGEFTIPIS